ncbi:hypothetical protein H5410_043896 [Solanum commersonii]|uniref:Uncharacterized protein n=1 Tax=Solanum commersonii TaxID=4109 RepID=A0A9J5Y2M6_SOLCO|nr:hypothetical protein H5410_043896 [Solanum commersonii]
MRRNKFMFKILSHMKIVGSKIVSFKRRVGTCMPIKLNITVVEEGFEITGGENSVARNYGVERDVGRDESYLADLGGGEDTPGVIKTTNLDGQQSKRTIYPSYVRKSPYTPALKRRLTMNFKAKNAMKSRLEMNLYKPLDVEK